MPNSTTAYWKAIMDSSQALNTLEQRSYSAPSERLRSARFLAQNATKADRSRIQRIRETEHNSWIQKALDRAILRTEPCNSDAAVAEVIEEEESHIDRLFCDDVYAQATEETSAMFLHELRPLVGILELDANSEIDCYICSNTKVAVTRIQSFLDVIDMLRHASAAPIIKDFDLTDLVVRVSELESRRYLVASENLSEEENVQENPDGCMEQFSKSKGIGLTLARREPVFSSGAPKLVELALGNALRNAFEATLEVKDDSRGDIVLNWGNTDIDSWIVVLDEGCGLPTGLNRLREPGISTKSKEQSNFGMGLPIAERALHSINGTITLTPRAEVGVSCEIRWPQRRK